MATTTVSGLGVDPTQYPVYGSTEEQQQKYHETLQDQIKALENRYAQPNWFKVAAGFAKPQLGGFLASLGSASEALGENVEQQRASALPIAQMRAQLAQSEALMGQNVDVSSQIKKWRADPKNAGQMPPGNLVADWASRAPKLPAVEAFLAQQSLAQKNQELLQGQQKTEMELLGKAREVGDITLDQYKEGVRNLRARLGTMATSPNVPSSAVSGETPTTETTKIENQLPKEKFDLSKPGAIENVKRAIEQMADPVARIEAMRQFNAQINPNNMQAKPTGRDAAQEAFKSEYPAEKAKESTFDTSSFKIKPSFERKDLIATPVTASEIAHNASLNSGAALLEGEKQKQYQGLQKINDSVGFGTANDANKAVLEMLDKDPDSAVATTNMLRRKGPLAAGLAKGLGINVGPYGVHVRAEGILPALYASLTPEQQDYQDKLLNGIARSVYYDLISRGIDPEKEGAEKFGQRMLQETHIEQGPSAIHRAIKQNDIRLMHNQKLFKTLSDYYPQAIKAGSMSPLHDIQMQHPEVKVLNGLLQRRLKEAN